jgi:hypothetical protein
MSIKILKRISCEDCDEDTELKKVEIDEIDWLILCSNCIRIRERLERNKEQEECRGDDLRQKEKDRRLENEKEKF